MSTFFYDSVNSGKDISEIRPETNLQNAGNIAASTKKKGVNWTLIGGILIGAFVLYKVIKKK